MTAPPIGLRTRAMRSSLIWFSNLLMLPWFHHARGPWPTRWGGCICVLRTRGRKSGVVREAPLDYAPTSDGIAVLAGLGERTHWLANIHADPRVEVRFPERTVGGVATPVDDPAERLRIIRAVLCHCGLVGYCYGFSPFTVTDRRLERAARGVVAVRIVLDGPPPRSPLATRSPA